MNWWEGFFAGLAVALVPSAMILGVIVGAAVLRIRRDGRTEVDLSEDWKSLANMHRYAELRAENVRYVNFYDYRDTPGGGNAA
jgi:hypothetical protein